MHQVNAERESATISTEDHEENAHRRAADRAVAVSAVGLAATGTFELVVALVSGSAGLLGDALHNLADVSTSLVVFLGFRISGRVASERYPYGLERAEDLAGLGVALVIWVSAVVSGVESVLKLVGDRPTDHLAVGVVAASVGIAGNQLVARYKLRVGRRIRSTTMISDAKHSWLDALSSAGALIGLVGVALGWRWADPVAGLVVTVFIAHVGWEVTRDLAHRLLDGVDDGVVRTVERAAAGLDGIVHAHARARWTGRTLRVEVEGWVDPERSVHDAEQLAPAVAEAVHTALPEARAITFIPRSGPAFREASTTDDEHRRRPPIGPFTNR